jgi:hypothetical protein
MSLSPSEAMQQAGDTAHDFTRQAIRNLREITGFKDQRITDDAILKRHPAIIAAMIQAASSDYFTWVFHQSAERLAQAIEGAGNHDKPF